MKNIYTDLTATILLTFSLISANAQNPSMTLPADITHDKHHRADMSSPKERARSRTQQMDDALGLDEKQYKKIYKIFFKEENAKDAASSNGAPMGPPPGAIGGGRPPQGSGFSPENGAGGPPSGPRPEVPSHIDGYPSEPPVVKVGGKAIDSDEYIDSREEKFRQILTEHQYSLWRKLHPDPTGFFIR